MGTSLLQQYKRSLWESAWSRAIRAVAMPSSETRRQTFHVSFMPNDQTATLRLLPDPAGIAEAGRLLRAGETVAFPTETVYGLGADARSSEAVAKIYAAKARPSFNPLIVHVPDRRVAQTLAVWNATAERLAQAFWPGALTLVLPLRPDAEVSPLVTAGLSTLAVRCPAGEVAQAVLEAAACPVAAPSANPSGRMSSTTAAHVLSGLDGKIGAVMDGGPCPVGVESTILGLAPDPVLLRPGGVTAEALADVLGQAVAPRAQSAAISAPGQLSSHYAPRARLRLHATHPEGDEVLIGFGPIPGMFSLSETGSLNEAAMRLFPVLHAADEMERPLAVAPIPEEGLGRAINDRLRRAAAPRPMSD